jgi:hypothetical protein
MVFKMMKAIEMNKYPKDNWKKGLKVSNCFDSTMRHLLALQRGELIDPEDGLPHVGGLLANAMFISFMLKNKPELNDL